MPDGFRFPDNADAWRPLAAFTGPPDSRALNVFGRLATGASVTEARQQIAAVLAPGSMAWYRTDLYHRVLTYSGTYVNQQWPYNRQTPHGAWEYHERLIPAGPRKPLRIWLEVGDRDLLDPNVMRDGMHDWVVANERMATALADKGYPYQFVFARNSGHGDRAVKQQTLPEALEYLWQGYAPSKN